MTYAGSLGYVWVAIAIVCALVWRRPAVIAWVLAADVAADLVSDGLRQLIGRTRPSVRYASPHPLVATPHSGSFPSGHATIAFACATVLSAFAPRLAAPLFLLAVAIAFSRVYVGVHYPLDVLGGALLGLALGGLLTVLRRLATARRG